MTESQLSGMKLDMFVRECVCVCVCARARECVCVLKKRRYKIRIKRVAEYRIRWESWILKDNKGGCSGRKCNEVFWCSMNKVKGRKDFYDFKKKEKQKMTRDQKAWRSHKRDTLWVSRTLLLQDNVLPCSRTVLRALFLVSHAGLWPSTWHQEYFTFCAKRWV